MDCGIQRTEMLRLLHPTDTNSRDGNQRNKAFFDRPKKERNEGSNPPFGNSPRSAPHAATPQQRAVNSIRPPSGLPLFLKSGAARPPLFSPADDGTGSSPLRERRTFILHALPSLADRAIILFSLFSQTPGWIRFVLARIVISLFICCV